ncbi:hypothetical protein RND71_022149 [Anisodus tanguticus]|uniref:Uncharacterized protein n=1 Tax=Anisodus tanguticus TaxID=243964 RepID=A0AAE1VGU3_9SOLA|nr:hypothetical protein RND71_022149 [Anisodus tanguticus]
MEIEGAEAGKTATPSNDKLSSVNAHVLACVLKGSTVEFLILVVSCYFPNTGAARRKILKLTSEDQKGDGVAETLTSLLSLSAFLQSLFIRSYPEYEKTILAMSYRPRLVKVILGDYMNLTNQVVGSLSRRHDKTLKLLNLDEWRVVADASLMAVVDNFPLLNDLVVSKCALTDYSLAALSYPVQVSLQVFFLPDWSTISNKNVASFAFIFVATKELCQQGYLETGFMIELRVPQSSLYIFEEFKTGLFDYFIVIDASKSEGLVYELKKEPDNEELGSRDKENFIKTIIVSSLKLKSESATPTCLLEGETTCAKVCYGEFAPVEICYNGELSYKLEPITKHRPEAFYKENDLFSRKVAALLHNILRFLSYEAFHNCQEEFLEHCSKGTKVLSEGGYDKIFHQTFEADLEEQLQNSFACYLSISAGPVMEVLYLSTAKLAFCSDNPLSYKTEDKTEWSYYKRRYKHTHCKSCESDIASTYIDTNTQPRNSVYNNIDFSHPDWKVNAIDCVKGLQSLRILHKVILQAKNSMDTSITMIELLIISLQPLLVLSELIPIVHG